MIPLRNLYQYFCELGAEVQVRRNDALTLAHIDALNPQKSLSLGPCTPNDAGISLAVIRHYAGRIPMLGVCRSSGDGAGLWCVGGAGSESDAR